MLDAPSESTAVPALFSLKGKVSFVTGGIRGIGLEAAKGLAEAGSSVAVTYSSSSEEDVRKAVEVIRGSCGEAVVKAYKLDVSSPEDIDRVTDAVEADLGRLDIVVINAGISYHIPAAEYPADKFRKQMQVNLDGAFFCAQAAHRVFRKQQAAGKLRQGSIIFTASISGRMVNTPQPQAPYNSSKAGLIGLAKCLAYEWTDVCKVNCVSPGYIATDMIGSVRKDWTDEWLRRIPGGRMCAPHELKGIYVFLASDASSYMTGSDVVIDGGYSLM
jgi:sorbose reductase